MSFHERRRQQFMSEKNFHECIKHLPESIEYFSTHPYGSGSSPHEKNILARLTSASDAMNLLLVKYTAGENIEVLRESTLTVIEGYEAASRYIWSANNNTPPIYEFDTIDGYSELMQVIGFCILVHRRDLLPRIARLQDGPNEENGGTDTLFEEFMAHTLDSAKRYECDILCCSKPYRALFHALTEITPEAQIHELHKFLKRWYKDLAGCAWHNTHKPDENGDQNGYFGYWSFEAGAAVILLNIEDDSSLHKYIYYPKDLVAWCRANESKYSADTKTLGDPATAGGIAAGQFCPKSGWWFTPAKANSRRYIQQGIAFPAIEDSDYGTTFWQWSPDQSAPTL